MKALHLLIRTIDVHLLHYDGVYSCSIDMQYTMEKFFASTDLNLFGDLYHLCSTGRNLNLLE